MKILLIDADSTIPNLALMKLSAWHKQHGDRVDLLRLSLPYYPTKKKRHFITPRDYNRVYCSVIFNENYKFIHGDNIVFGGTGFNNKIKLKDEIESCDPDYSIYPDNDTSYGFISRGCIRKCSFCSVPEKEGITIQVSTIDKIVRHKKVKFFDNNILSLPNHLDILDELIGKNIRCEFNQGLDIRLLTPENSVKLSKLNYSGHYTFAFDDWSYLRSVEKGLDLLQWRKPFKVRFFVYCHPDISFQNICNRIEWLRNNELLPYVMRHVSCWESPYNHFYIDIASYSNQPNLIKKMTFQQFLEKRHKDKNRIESSSHIYYEALSI